MSKSTLAEMYPWSDSDVAQHEGDVPQQGELPPPELFRDEPPRKDVPSSTVDEAPLKQRKLAKKRCNGTLSSKPLPLPPAPRVVKRTWRPAGTDFTWSELCQIGDTIIMSSSFIRLHYTMRPVNGLARQGVKWIDDTKTVIVADGALYLHKGDLWAYYSDSDFMSRENLDCTEDCSIFQVDELQ